MSATKNHTQNHNGSFVHSREQFDSLIETAFAQVKKLGADSAAAEVSEGHGLSVSVRKGALENIERNRDKSLGVTVYLGQRRGNASTSDFSHAAIVQTVQAAYDIARFTAEDPFAGLPEVDALATPEQAARSLDLIHPWSIDAEQATQLALRCEAAALDLDPRIANSEGAGVSAQQSHFLNSQWRAGVRVFTGGYATSRHSISVAPIAVNPKNANDMQRDAWYSSMRNPLDLAAPEAIGRYAAERALSRLNAKRIPTGEWPVLFESGVAVGLLGAVVQALSGGAMYRKTTFLLDSMGKAILPSHIDVDEDPFIPRGKGSAPFDDEGVLTRERKLIDAGVAQGYFLSTYSARKLGVHSTGHAGGSHNLALSSKQTRSWDDLPAMLRKLNTGLFVTELMGQGVNYVTGDYSRGASGYWVENGEIAYPVEEITIASTMQAMLKGIEAVGADAYTFGAKTIGSVLINRMKVAGA